MLPSPSPTSQGWATNGGTLVAEVVVPRGPQHRIPLAKVVLAAAVSRHPTYQPKPGLRLIRHHNLASWRGWALSTQKSQQFVLMEHIPAVALPFLSAETSGHYPSAGRAIHRAAWYCTRRKRQPRRRGSGPRTMGATGHITPSASPTSCPRRPKSSDVVIHEDGESSSKMLYEA